MNERVAVQVDSSNVEQLRAWDGAQGDHWTARADRIDEGVARYRDQFLDAAEIGPASNVLDIGCGTGQTTRDAARRAATGAALGVDLSSQMVELARARAEREQVANATFLQADAQIHEFPEAHFDVAISRHGVMFFGDPAAAFENVVRAIRRGGRMVLLVWQPIERNEWISAFRTALAAGRDLPEPPPFSFGDPDRVRTLLTSTGLSDVRLRGLNEPMYFGRDVDDACDFVSGQFAGLLDSLDADGRERALDDLRASMTEHSTDRGVLYDSANWLVEAQRR
ncbi:class I SAM-dependent methyltransferase [Saccharopolyspora spinosa]|uniref:Ubiquinone/menaquinone biosynthesis C-methylase UbiE n=1 Tax=Saccharopolyspora spinosa TaxID=60894 RepID=A0A2N3Y4I2_SACSN|nr:class I SAM-dependent methyltransferase [Saccharopolyspora spinosa]PKW17814.1 ubiquinone/menaquinone biosynthesis C-methylase UbiE [Saccharopolyspora spinosa]